MAAPHRRAPLRGAAADQIGAVWPQPMLYNPSEPGDATVRTPLVRWFEVFIMALLVLAFLLRELMPRGNADEYD